MTLQDLYQRIGGSYEDTLRRMNSEARVQKYVTMFLEDLSFSDLETGLEDGQIEAAFRAAHTLKGVCQNLGFDTLYTSSVDVCEALRVSDLDRARDLFPKCRADYQKTIQNLRELLPQ